MERVDIFTGTLGKALGGAMGGYTTGKKEVIEMLRQRSRPYLFSNSLSPAICGASIAVFDMLTKSTELRDRVMDNANYFRAKLTEAGFDLKPSESAICALMLYDAVLSQQFAAELQKENIYVTGFYYPVVPVSYTHLIRIMRPCTGFSRVKQTKTNGKHPQHRIHDCSRKNKKCSKRCV